MHNLKNNNKYKLKELILDKQNIISAYNIIKLKHKLSNIKSKNDKILYKLKNTNDIVEFIIKILDGKLYKPDILINKRYEDISYDNISLLENMCSNTNLIIQQMFVNILEPIFESEYSDHSYGYRYNRSTSNAIAEIYFRLQKSNLHYVLEFNHDNIMLQMSHSKLIRKIWSYGIHDKWVIYIIRQILKSPIKINNDIKYQNKGIISAGILIPLLINVGLNEFDHWVENNWEEFPLAYKGKYILDNGAVNKGNGYQFMTKHTRLKRMHITRYGLYFKIFCRNYDESIRSKIAIKNWFINRLGIDIGDIKLTNTKINYIKFLDFKIKVYLKNNKYVVISHIDNKRLNELKNKLKKAFRQIVNYNKKCNVRNAIVHYNMIVRQIHMYFCLATNICDDCRKLYYPIMKMMRNNKFLQILSKTGRNLTNDEKKYYGNSSMLRYSSICNEPIYPITYVKCVKPMHFKKYY